MFQNRILIPSASLCAIYAHFYNRHKLFKTNESAFFLICHAFEDGANMDHNF